MEIQPIGYVKNELKKPEHVKNAGEIISKIVIDKKFESGLYKIEYQKFVDVIFHFHQSGDFDLVGPIFTGETRGVFASRSPRRPNGLGVSTVRLLKKEENILIVSGLDAIDGTPVIDLKPSDFSFFRQNNEDDDLPLHNPRFNIEKHISRGETKQLLKMAGQIHGHFCPGLAMGVIAAVHGMQRFKQISDGMEKILAIVETNNCFADGIQYVSGCTFGNNGLIFKDQGKNAVTFATRNGKGFRIRGRNDLRQTIGRLFPEFETLFDEVIVKRNDNPEKQNMFNEESRKASFGMLELDFSKLFVIEEENVKIPPYAPIEESLQCDECGEIFMASRGKNRENRNICNKCLNVHHPFLDGYGIHCT
ncbi:MAG: hypothetical protein PWQ17_2218 [Anaerophaga sp.]|nr:hypothetical protein [Anaerophaga sp.]